MDKETFELLESIARTHDTFNHLRIEGRDSLDFTSISKGVLLAMLKDAYERGLADGCSCGI